MKKKMVVFYSLMFLPLAVVLITVLARADPGSL